MIICQIRSLLILIRHLPCIAHFLCLNSLLHLTELDMKVYWSKITLIATVASTGLTGLVSIAPQTQAQERAQVEEQTQPQNKDEESDNALQPIACLGMGTVSDEDEEPDLTRYTDLDGTSRFWTEPSEANSVTFRTQEGWKRLKLLNKDIFPSGGLNLHGRGGVTNLDDDDAAVIAGIDTGAVCNALSAGVLGIPLLLGSVTDGGIVQSANEELSPEDPDSGNPNPGSPNFGNPDSGNPNSGGSPNPPSGANNNPPASGQKPANSNPPKTPEETTNRDNPPGTPNEQPPSKEPEPIPTPALLPGLIGCGIAALRKQKSKQTPTD